MMKFSGIVFLIDAGSALRSWRMGTRGLRVLARPHAKASLDGGALYVSDGDETVQLAASRWLIARARRHALPKATL